jgi:hypothetical protein
MSTAQMTRNATLDDLVHILREQHGRKVDVVANADAISARDGRLVIVGTEPLLTEDGVTTTDGMYLPTLVCDEGISQKLGIPLAYVRRMRAERPDLWDANVNGWLHGDHTGESRDTRSFLVRCFKADGVGGHGIARAFLSDRYKMVDNLDVLMSSLEGISEAGVQVDITSCDLTDRRMYVKVAAPEVAAIAPTLLRGYRSPFTGASGDENPTVWAGFVISNSEVGAGATAITPQVIVQVCKNGMTVKKDAMRAVHLGGQMDEGVVDWSSDTVDKALALIKAKTRDAVRTFLSPEYLTKTVESLEERAAQPVDNVDAVKRVVKPLSYSQAQMDGILGRFVQGGQMTLAGVANAITAHAQDISDADVAHEMEAQAVGLLV